MRAGWLRSHQSGHHQWLRPIHSGHVKPASFWLQKRFYAVGHSGIFRSPVLRWSLSWNLWRLLSCSWVSSCGEMASLMGVGPISILTYFDIFKLNCIRASFETLGPRWHVAQEALDPVASTTPTNPGRLPVCCSVRPGWPGLHQLCLGYGMECQ